MTGAWWEEAACLGMDTDLWFCGRMRSRALRVCAACPVAMACLEASLREEAEGGESYRYGIRGGLTPDQRKRLVMVMARRQVRR